MRRSRFWWDFSTLLASYGAGEVLAAIGGLVIVRLLAPEDYARYVLAVTAVGLAGVAVHFGMNPILTREVSRQPERAPMFLTHGVVFRLVCAAIVYPLAYTATQLWPAAGDPNLILIASLAFFPATVKETVIALLNGLNRISVNAALNITTQLIETALVIGALLAFRQPGPILAAGVIASLAGALLYVWASRRVVRPAMHVLPELAGKLGVLALPLMLMSLASSAFQSLDVYVVSFFLGQAAVGVYGAAMRLLGLLLMIPTAWSIVALPRFSRAADNSEATWRLLRQALLTVGIGSVCLAALVTTLAHPLTTWVLGERYGPAAGVLGVLVWVLALAGLSAPLTTLLTAHNRQGAVAVAVAVSGILALAANVLLAGRLGVTGIALVKVAAMIFLFGACGWLSRDLMRPVERQLPSLTDVNVPLP